MISGAARIAGVAGRPIAHSLSPLIHNAWLAAAGLDGVYAPFAPEDEAAFARLVRGLQAGGAAGLNVTAPFKAAALDLAGEADAAARRAGSANLLLFREDGVVEARSTDGAGMMAALAEQAPGFDPAAAPAVVLGAGGAARAAAAALLDAGAPEVRIVNRSAGRAEALVFDLQGPTTAFALSEAARAMSDAGLLVNAAAGGPTPPVDALPSLAVVMDMTYRPLHTATLRAAAAGGRRTVDGLAMLIAQARPAFEALFGQATPELDVRALCLAALEPAR